MLNVNDFGENFHWGISTSAFQSEGAVIKDGKGPSIWDTFSGKKGKIYQNHSPEHSCDFYHLFREDLLLLKAMNIKNFRFSISWSRVLPDGIGIINPKGIAYYTQLLEVCKELEIEPWVTLYHWDLPHALELKGGWTNREVVNWFENFVNTCIAFFGDKITHWMVLNEPMVFTGAGYFLGIHAPGRRGIKNFLPAVHHAALCQSLGIRMLKSHSTNYKVGTTFSCSYVEPINMKASNLDAAKRVDALINRMYLEPLLGEGYPIKALPMLNRLEPFIKANDEANLEAKPDFIGLQCYTREIVKSSWFVPYMQASTYPHSKRNTDTITQMNWEVYPECIYHMLKQFGSYKNAPEIIITENGAAFPDSTVDGIVHDPLRISYIKDHLYQVRRAQKEGINVTGYFVWTFTDNFEWAEGYKPRFGLVYVDFKSQQRIIKDSGKWYAKFLEDN